MKPNFFIIGAPKCGTTALNEYLKTHPNLFLSTPKEPNYFGEDINRPAPRNLEAYLSLFSQADPLVHKAVGEATTAYLFSKKAVPEILAFNPKAKFIVMLRNPVDMLPANHSEGVYQGSEDILDFERAWRTEQENPGKRKFPNMSLVRTNQPYAKKGMLGEQIERLFMTVPRNRVLVILFDDFISNTRQSYEDVLDFLDLPSDHRTNFPKVNPNKPIRWLWLHALLSLLRAWAAVLKGRLGTYRNFGTLKWLLRLNIGTAERKQISDEFRREMKDYFREDISKLSKLLGRDLSHWVS